MVAAADPTLDSLARFEDPSLWVIVRNVPVFDEHDEVNEKGEVIRHFGRSELERIAESTNRLRAASAVVPKITLGHTLTRNPKTGEQPRETDQPPIVGYAPKGLRLGTFGPARKLALLTDLYFRREDYAEAKTYPHRSVELYPSTNQITGIALLRRDPQLDLGLLTYGRDNGPRYYQMENDMPEELKPGTPPVVPAPDGDQGQDDPLMAALHKHPAFQYMCKRYMDETGDQDMGGMARYMAAPSGTNTVVPAGPEGDATRMQREQEAIRYGRLEREVEALRKANEAGVLRYQRAERERELVQLEAEGYQFDRAELLADVEALPADQYGKRIAFVKTYGRQAPIGETFLRTGDLPRHGPVKQHSKADVDRAVRYCQDHPGTSYDEALKKVSAA